MLDLVFTVMQGAVSTLAHMQTSCLMLRTDPHLDKCHVAVCHENHCETTVDKSNLGKVGVSGAPVRTMRQGAGMLPTVAFDQFRRRTY